METFIKVQVLLKFFGKTYSESAFCPSRSSPKQSLNSKETEIESSRVWTVSSMNQTELSALPEILAATPFAFNYSIQMENQGFRLGMKLMDAHKNVTLSILTNRMPKPENITNQFP